MTPLPASAWPPSWDQSVGAPMKVVLESVWGWLSVSTWTAATSGSDRSVSTWSAGRVTATPPYTRCRLTPAMAAGSRVARSLRNVWSMPDV